MTTSITFWGAAGQVTGSCHLLETNGRRVLLDCGMFQGKRDESAQMNATMPFDPRQLDCVVLSHAHIDHSGRLPLLVNRQFDHVIHATAATRDLCATMLPDSAHIQESDFAWLLKKGRAGKASSPLYSMANAVRAVELMESHPYDRPFKVAGDLAVTYRDAGHILGSANVEVEIPGPTPHRLVFSGDIGRWGQPIIRDPGGPRGPIDTLIIESTYALKNHDTSTNATEHLGEIVRRVADRKGIILIPSFALGRTQELIYALHQLADAKQIPQIPIYVDSPLAVEATAVFRMHPELFDNTELLIQSDSKLFDYHLVTYVRDVNESKQLNSLNGPAIIIAASGMAENGRITHHLANHIENPRNCVLIVGFQAEYTLGRRIVERRPFLKIFGEMLKLRANVEVLNGYSGHGDANDLTGFIEPIDRLSHIFIVHGEISQSEGLAKRLRKMGRDWTIEIPERGDALDPEQITYTKD